MIEYVVEQNPDDRIIARASQILRNGGLICFPTDTNWKVVANPFDKKGVDALYKLRHVDNTKHFTILCEDFKKATEIAFIDDGSFRLIKRVIPGPYTFILEAQKKITKHLKASKIDKEVGIRFAPNKLTRKILESFGDVLISTHITHEMLGLEEDGTTPLYGALIEDSIGHQIDLIIDPGEYSFIGPTTIVSFTSGIPELIREGSGDTTIFL